MKKMSKIVKIVAVVIMTFTTLTALAQNQTNGNEIQRKKDVKDEAVSLVIVGNDTINEYLRGKNWGRFDRKLYNHLYIPKGGVAVGLAVSFGNYDTSDMRLLSYIKDLDIKVRAYSIKPEVSVFFRHNQAIGLRFGYSKGDYNVNSLSVDFDEDINFSIKDVKYSSQQYSTSLYYRNYVGLDRSRRFAIFNEVAFVFAAGNAMFSRLYNNEPRITESNDIQLRLNFSPGLSVFMHPNASFNLSFGVFGWYFTKEKQRTNGLEEGIRTSSGASFKFNIFNLNMGLNVHF